MIIRQIKLSQKERDKLIRIKAKTGLEAWNVICRWALCVSIADPTIPFGPDVPSDSNVEMSWGTFGGEYQELYDAIFRERCKTDGIENDPIQIAKYFRLHLQRGINSLAAKTGPKNVTEMLNLINGSSSLESDHTDLK